MAYQGKHIKEIFLSLAPKNRKKLQNIAILGHIFMIKPIKFFCYLRKGKYKMEIIVRAYSVQPHQK